jgi:hypothetical protein
MVASTESSPIVSPLNLSSKKAAAQIQSISTVPFAISIWDTSLGNSNTCQKNL